MLNHLHMFLLLGKITYLEHWLWSAINNFLVDVAFRYLERFINCWCCYTPLFWQGGIFHIKTATESVEIIHWYATVSVHIVFYNSSSRNRVQAMPGFMCIPLLKWFLKLLSVFFLCFYCCHVCFFLKLFNFLCTLHWVVYCLYLTLGGLLFVPYTGWFAVCTLHWVVYCLYFTLGGLLFVPYTGWFTVCTLHWVVYCLYLTLGGLLFVPYTGWFAVCTLHWVVYCLYLTLDGLLFVPYTGWFAVCTLHWVVYCLYLTLGGLLFVPYTGWFTVCIHYSGLVFHAQFMGGLLFVPYTGWFTVCTLHWVVYCLYLTLGGLLFVPYTGWFTVCIHYSGLVFHAQFSSEINVAWNCGKVRVHMKHTPVCAFQHPWQACHAFLC